MSDRPVATDALATLGTIIDDAAKRDAIHLAVIPVVAGSRLEPGAHITVTNGVAEYADDPDAIGIVDPFLKNPARKGQRFWCVLYPRTINSLRHVWTHPAFPDEPAVSDVDDNDEVPPGILAARKQQSEQWLRRFCDRSDCPSYETVIAMAAAGDMTARGSSASGEIPDEFWTHAEIVLGRKLEDRPSYFSCSC